MKKGDRFILSASLAGFVILGGGAAFPVASAGTRTVSVNFKGNNADGRAGNHPVSTGPFAGSLIGFSGYAVAGSNWVDCAGIGCDGGVPNEAVPLTLRDDTGDAVPYSGVRVFLCSRPGTYTAGSSSGNDGNTQMLYAYLDDGNANRTNRAGFKLENLPFIRYTALVYFNRDTDGGGSTKTAIPAYNINGSWYKGSTDPGGGTVPAAENDAWGWPCNATGLSTDRNTLIVSNLTNATLIVRTSPAAAGRGCISGFQVSGELPDGPLSWAGGDGSWSDAGKWTPFRWVNGLAAIFPEGGAGPVAVDADATVSSLDIHDSYTFTAAGGSIRLSGPVTVAEGKAAAILAPVSGALEKRGAGLLAFDPARASCSSYSFIGPVSLAGGTLEADFALAGDAVFTNGVFRRASAAGWAVPADQAPAVTLAAGATLDLAASRPGQSASLAAASAGTTLAAVIRDPLAAEQLIRADAAPAGLAFRFRNNLGTEIPAGRYTVELQDGFLTYQPVATELEPPFTVTLTGDAEWTTAGWKDTNDADVPAGAWALAGETRATVAGDGIVLTVDTDVTASSIAFLGEKPLTLKIPKGRRIAAAVSNGTGQAVTLDLSAWTLTEAELGAGQKITKPVITGAAEGLTAGALPEMPGDWGVRAAPAAGGGIALVYVYEPVFFTDPAGWKAATTFPETAKRDAPAAEPSYAFDDVFLQTLGGRRATVVSVVTNGAAGISLWGVHKQQYANADNKAFDRDIFLDVRGGTFNKVSAGLAAWWDGISNASVKGRQLTQLAGTARAGYVFGAGEQGGKGSENEDPKLTGDAGVVIKDTAVVLGTVVGAWTTQHNRIPTVTGSSVVRIENVQGETAPGNLSNLPAGLIIGGSAWCANSYSRSLVGGDTSVIVDIPAGTAPVPANFVKTIIGGSRSAPVNVPGYTFNGDQTVEGNASVTISAPLNVSFTGPVYAGGMDPSPGGNGTVVVKGRATLTLNGGTFACGLNGGIANGEKTIVFTGTNVLGAGASLSGFGRAEFREASVTRIAGPVGLDDPGAVTAGPGAVLEVAAGGRLSCGAAVATSLPPFAKLDGGVFITATFSDGKIQAGTLAEGLGEQDMKEHFSGRIANPATGIRTPAIFSLEGRKVMIAPAEPFVWNTTDGEWTDASFNNATAAFQEGGTAVFSDSAYSDPSIIVTNRGGKKASDLVFNNADATAYVLEGDAVTARDFSRMGAGAAAVTVNAPLRMEGGEISFSGASSTTLADVGGNVGAITLATAPAGAAWGGTLTVDLAGNNFTLTGPVSIGDRQTLALASSLAGLRTVWRPVDGPFAGTAFIPTASSADAELRFAADISCARIDKRGPGAVRFNGNTTLGWMLNVYEGVQIVNGALLHPANLAEKPEIAVTVMPGATLRFEGDQERNRMPLLGKLLCDGGRVELYGVNLFQDNKVNGLPNGLPHFILTNGAALFLDCSRKDGHHKLAAVSLTDSDIVVGGGEKGYNDEALIVRGAVTAAGAGNHVRYEAGAYPNIFCPDTVDVREGGCLEVAVKTKEFVKTGPGTLAAAAGSAFTLLTVRGGTLKIPSASGTFEGLTMEGGAKLDLSEDRSVLRVDGGLSIEAGETVEVNLAGRDLSGDARKNGKCYIVKWQTPPDGTLVPEGLAGARILQLDDGAALFLDGTVLILR